MKKHPALSVFLVSILPCFLLFIYAPIETYVTNITDFSFDLYDLMKMMLPAFFICIVIIASILLISKKMNKHIFLLFLSLCFAVSVAMYIQGTFLSKFLPQLDGEDILWESFRKQRFFSILLWSGMIIVFSVSSFLIPAEKLQQGITYSSLFITIILLLTTVISLFSGNILEDKDDYVITSDHMLDMSDDKNVIVLLLDMVGNPEFKDYLETHPEKKDIFENFTCFDNAVGAYRYTICSIPYIFSGEWYEYQCDFGEYKQRALSESKIFSELTSRGFSIGMYDTDMVLPQNDENLFVNIHPLGKNHFAFPVKFILMQIELAGIRYFPFDLKRFCELTPQNILDDSLKSTENEHIFETGNGYTYDLLHNHKINITKSPTFRYIHVEGVHPPYSYDSNCNFNFDATYEDAIGACFTLVSELISQLKAAGIYDSTSIVIMSDHGGNDSRQNPMFCVKGSFEMHPFIMNTSPIAWGDLSEAFVRLADQKQSSELFDCREGDNRERRYLSYGTFGNDPLTEYIQYGYADNASTLLPTGKIFSKTH